MTHGKLCRSVLSVGTKTPTDRQIEDNSRRAISTAVALGLSRLSRTQSRTVCVLALHDLKRQLQVVSGPGFGRLHFAVRDDGDIFASGDRFEVVGWFDGVGIKAVEVRHGCFLGWMEREVGFKQ